MVLIFSINNDLSTSEVIKWLIYNQIDFIRINEDVLFKVIELSSDNLILETNEKEIIDLKKVKSVWYRRGFLNIEYSLEYFSKFSKIEKDSLINILETNLFSKKFLNNFNNSSFNKLNIYWYNSNKYFKIPNTLITTKKEKLLSFFESNKSIISKPLAVPFSNFSKNGKLFMAYTTEIKINQINFLSEKFIPTLFQENINKIYEIRTFYLNKKFYSMCIFSQNNSNTKTDFRNYDEVKPNRTAPYKLNTKIKKDLHKMLKFYKIDSASLDLVVDKLGNYYLLDVNPVGQFGMVSYPCNYNLEYEIYNFLIK